MLVLVRNKNNAIPPDALPVPAFPLLALERYDITSEWIFGHLSKFFEQELVVITRHLFELFGRVFCEPDVPLHVRVFLRSRILPVGSVLPHDAPSPPLRG